MKLFKNVRRWTVRVLGLLLLVSALFLSGTAMGQSPTPNPLPKITYTKNTVFHLPVQMDERTRANMREVCLYVKAGNGEWQRQETGVPTLPHFSYTVPRDGEYWFSLVTIDKAGHMTPADVNLEPPGLRVMVDTQPPTLDVQPWTSPEGDFCLRCQLQDANPDLQSIKASYRDQTGEHFLEGVPGNPTLFKIAGPNVLNQPLRITGADLSGNAVSRDVNVKDMVVATLQNNRNQAQNMVPTPPPLEQRPQFPNVPNDLVRSEVQRPTLPPMPEKGMEFGAPGLPPVAHQGMNNAQQFSPPQAPYLPANPPMPANPQMSSAPQMPAAPQYPGNPQMPGNPQLPNYPPLPGKDIQQVKAGFPAPQNNTPKLILNTKHATVEYRIDQVGPSGVGKVEVYLTGDGGLNWQRLQEDTDRRSPAEIELPGEGLFGIRLSITNGNGFGGTPPSRGDAPTCWIEVDTTAPFVQLRPIDPAQNGVMELRWTASDKNLGAEPIALYYKNRHDGPWQVVARNVKNEGLYRWTFPRDQGSQFFVKIEVIDMAGNTAFAETPNPIVLDITEPHASVVGVTGMTQRVTPQVGN